MAWLGRKLAEHTVAKMADPVEGSLHVTACSYPPTDVSAMYANYRLVGVLQAEGLQPTAIEHNGMAKTANWPQLGSDLPVTIDRATPQNFVIHWDQVPDTRANAFADAQALATQLATGIDPAVLDKAVEQADTDTAPPWLHSLAPQPSVSEASPGTNTTPSPQPDPAQPDWARPGLALPESSCTVPAKATVTAVQDVPGPAGLMPAGGIVDLTLRITGGDGSAREVVGRVSLHSTEQRARLTALGATIDVLLDPADPDAVNVPSE